MSYVKFNIEVELKKATQGRKTKANPQALLALIAAEYLQLTK
jgi:hypothetical protein